MKTEQLSNQTALITGACQGIGLAVARTLARAGMRIVGVDQQEKKLSDQMQQLSDEFGIASLPVTADVGDENDIVHAVRAAKEAFGDINVLVNNAGIRKLGTVWETSAESWDETMAINLRGQFLFAREVLKQSMLAMNRGKLIFVSSIAGRRGAKNSTAYCVSKWGIRGLAFAIAQDLKDSEINVTVVTPGRCDTPMARLSEQWNPELGWLDPETVGEAVLYFIRQSPSVVLPEIHIHHSAEL